MRKTVLSLGAGLMALSMFLTACGGAKPSTEAPKAETQTEVKADPETKELVIYSGRNESLVKPVIEAFQQKYGVKVSVKSGGAAELANVVLEEKSNPKADIYLANDAGSLERLRKEQALEAYTSDALKLVPEDLKAPDNTWHAVTARARVIMYNKNLVKENELPKSLKDLADPKWKGQIGMATGANESVIANVTALRLIDGDAATEKFLSDLKKNEIKIFKGHGDVRQAVGKGEIKLGWVNHYYAYQQMNEKENNQVGIVWPDQDQGGVTVNISGFGIVKGARNLANAKKFADFLLSPEAQQIFADANYEFPVRPDAKATKVKESLAQIKRNPVKLGQFGAEWDKSTKLIDKLGLVLN